MGKKCFDRRIASNGVSLDGRVLGRYVVELVGDNVVGYYPLTHELPFTEWLQEPVRMFTDCSGVVRVRVIV